MLFLAYLFPFRVFCFHLNGPHIEYSFSFIHIVNMYREIDLPYVCTVLSNLMGAPVRIYENAEQTYYHSLTNLIVDPIKTQIDKLLNLEGHVGYSIVDNNFYYAFVQNDRTKIIVGPIPFAAEASDQNLKELAFNLDVPPDETDNFVLNMRNLVPMPLHSTIAALLAVNHILNGEKLSMADIIPIEDGELTRSAHLNEETEAGRLNDFENRDFNNSLSVEQAVTRIVRHGDLESLNRYIAQAPAINSGTLAKERLRQAKNTFIVSTTVICRAAIRGGMDVQDALKMSDSYIQQVELCKNAIETFSLQYQMVLDYTTAVNRLKEGAYNSKLVSDVRNYIIHHLSEPIKTSDMAESLLTSRSKLSTKFKEETGVNLSEFIMQEKVKEGKELLHYTDKPLSAISAYLGFSSQSHFSRIFNRIVGLSPLKYREKHR